MDVAFKKLFKSAKENDWSHFYQLGVMVSTDKLRGGIYTQAQYAIMPVQNKFDGEKCIVKPRGEYVLCIEGKSSEELEAERRRTFMDMELSEHMDMYLSRGMDKKEAMKAVAKDRGLSKRDIYNELNSKDR